MPVCNLQPGNVQIYLLRSIFCKNRHENNLSMVTLGKPPLVFCYVESLSLSLSWSVTVYLCHKPRWKWCTPPAHKQIRTKRLHEWHSLYYSTAVHVFESHSTITVTYRGDTNYRHGKKVNEWTNNVQNNQNQLQITDSVQLFLWIEKYRLKDNLLCVCECVCFCESFKQVWGLLFYFHYDWGSG